MPKITAPLGSASLLALAFAPALFARDAYAQACCSGTNTVSPARLAPQEDALLAAQMRFGWQTGSFDSEGRYVRTPSGSGEADLEQDLVLALHVVERAQLAVLLPVIETYRKDSTVSAVGGGFGDINIGGRYDFILAGESEIPGIALLAGVTLPTGTAVERAKAALATDATGIGAGQLSLGVAAEQVFERHLLLSLSAIGSQRLLRDIEGVTSRLGLDLLFSLSAGWVFDRNRGVAAVVRYEREGNATVNGMVDDRSGRSIWSFGVSGGVPIDGPWRAQAGLLAVLPISGLGQNQLATVSLTMAIIHTWL